MSIDPLGDPALSEPPSGTSAILRSKFCGVIDDEPWGLGAVFLGSIFIFAAAQFLSGDAAQAVLGRNAPRALGMLSTLAP